MDVDYSKLTVSQLKQNLEKKGVKMPIKTRKMDLVARLLEEDKIETEKGNGILMGYSF